MLPLLFRRNGTQILRANAVTSSARSFATAKFLDKNSKNAEAEYFFSKQDEELLRKMMDTNLDIAYDGGVNTMDNTSEGQVKAIFIRHGIPPLNKKLIADLVEIIDKK